MPAIPLFFARHIKCFFQQRPIFHVRCCLSPLTLLQAVRWINTKEDHAGSIISTVAEYMLAQRVKKELFDNEADYLQALAAHHALMQAAVKTKQVVDVAACDALDHAIADVGAMYTKK